MVKITMKKIIKKITFFLKKIFKQRRSDVSLFVFLRFTLFLIYYKINKKLKRLPNKKNSCLILFPPSLGLGDLIILSRIVDIIRDSNKYKNIKIGHFAPYLQLKDSSISLINLNNLINIKEIHNFEKFILPSPSLLNRIISFALGKSNCLGYLNNTNETNLKIRNNHHLSINDPYFYRLKPFKEFFKYKKDIKPLVWDKENRDHLKQKKSYLSINKDSNKEELFLMISTYNFYEKFRPCIDHIIIEIRKYERLNQIDNILILGANSKKEINYNFFLEKKLKEEFKNKKILNFSGKLNIDNSLELISQSTYYIGANNGLANVAQMLGIKCTLIFQGPEMFRKRRFSEFASFVTY